MNFAQHCLCVKFSIDLTQSPISTNLRTLDEEYGLVYGQEVFMSIIFLGPSLRVVVQERWEGNPSLRWFETLEVTHKDVIASISSLIDRESAF